MSTRGYKGAVLHCGEGEGEGARASAVRSEVEQAARGAA